MKAYRESVLFLVSTAFIVSGAIDVGSVSPSDPNIQYHGRWNFDNPDRPWVYWPGASIIARVEGTGISIELEAESGTEQYRVIVDGIARAERLYVTGRENKIIADGLAPGIHTIQVMKETYYGGKTFFHGLSITGKGLVEPPQRPSLRIAFFGDSNTDGSSNYSEKNTGDMGTYYAFPAMVSRMLEAEMNLQAVGGAKLADNGDNSVQSFIFSEDFFNQDSTYRSGFEPHIIVLNAGANDVGAGKATIKERYKAVLADLRKVYGESPHIVLFNAYGWDINEPALYIQEVVDEVGGNLSALQYPWLWERWHGCQWDHSGEAHMLVEHLTALNSQWMQRVPNDIINGFGQPFDVANGSFEHQAPFGGFGWRYSEDGVERLHHPGGAAHGDYYIRLEEGEEVHQPIDATGDMLPGGTINDQQYHIRAMIRGANAGAAAQIDADFEGQQIYNRHSRISHSISVDTTWQEYSTSFTAPNGSWKAFIILRSGAGTVEYDHIRVSDQP